MGDNLHYIKLNETNRIIEEFWPVQGVVNWINHVTETDREFPLVVDESWSLKKATEEEIHEIKRKYIFSLLKNEI